MAKPTLADFDHPLIFLFFLTLAMVPIIALLGVVFRSVNMPGPASLFRLGSGN